MSTGQSQALQDTVLEHLRKHKVPVTVFLVNGIKLQGTVIGFDSYSLLLLGISSRKSSTSTRSRPSCPENRSGWSDQPNSSHLWFDVAGEDRG